MPLRGGSKQLAYVVCEDLWALALAHEQAQPPRRVEDKRTRGMVHGIAARRRPGLLLIQDLEFARRLGGRRPVSGKTEEWRGGYGGVGGKQIPGVALRSDG